MASTTNERAGAVSFAYNGLGFRHAHLRQMVTVNFVFVASLFYTRPNNRFVNPFQHRFCLDVYYVLSCLRAVFRTCQKCKYFKGVRHYYWSVILHWRDYKQYAVYQINYFFGIPLARYFIIFCSLLDGERGLHFTLKALCQIQIVEY